MDSDSYCCAIKPLKPTCKIANWRPLYMTACTVELLLDCWWLYSLCVNRPLWLRIKKLNKLDSESLQKCLKVRLSLDTICIVRFVSGVCCNVSSKATWEINAWTPDITSTSETKDTNNKLSQPHQQDPDVLSIKMSHVWVQACLWPKQS